MDSSTQVLDDGKTELIHLVQVKEEADDEPHVVYDDEEPWTFLFCGGNDDPKEDTSDNKQDATDTKEETSDIKEEFSTCHWCEYSTTEPLDLIEHDFENHSRFFHGKRIHKSYKCPSCEYTSVEPKIIRNHFEQHRTLTVPTIEHIQQNDDSCSINLEKKKPRQSLRTLARLKREQREQKMLENSGDQKSNGVISKKTKMTPEERRLKKILQTRKYRASLTQEALAKRRLNDAARMRIKRAMESLEVKAERRRKQALHAREKRALETPEQVELRRTKQRNRARVRRSLESEEQRELRKERERLKARERRASLPAEKKLHIRQIDRIRKRVRDQRLAHFVDVNHLIHATEFLTTSLSPSENSYLQSSNSDETTQLYPENIFVDPINLASSLPKSKQAKRVTSGQKQLKQTSNGKGRRVKKRGRKSNRNKTVAKRNKVPESSISDPLAITFNDILQNQCTDVNNKNSMAEIKKVNYSKSSEVLPLNISASFQDRESVNKVELHQRQGSSKLCSIESLHNREGKQYELASPQTFTLLSSMEIHENTPSSVKQTDIDSFNNMKPNNITKMDKINKLLHRMCERDSKDLDQREIIN